jgi:hypothetical protein
MKRAGVVILAAVAIALLSTAAFAQPFPFWQNWHHDHHGSPAPLLAAGLPAFAALGGGAAIASLTRRFRCRK